MTDLFEVYRAAYMDIRARYEHPDPPVPNTGHGKTFPEALPPKGWGRETYALYFAEVTRLSSWYRSAREYAAKQTKTAQDRAGYEAACDRYAVAGKDLRFVGDPEPALFAV